jgi:hypothetical protein
MLKNLVLIAAGAAAATALIISCSDDSPADADAACACDPSEPPLAGRIVRVEQRQTASTAGLSFTASCADGAILLGGGCDADELNGASIDLVQAGNQGPNKQTYGCVWRNPNTVSVEVVAWAVCLNPAQ